MNLWRLFDGRELRFYFGLNGVYVSVAGRGRLLTHSQARRLFDAMGEAKP